MLGLLFFFSALGVFNGLLLSCYLFFFAKQKNLSKYLLGALILALSIRIGKSILLYFDRDLPKIYLQLGLSACLFIGPFLYFYLKTVLDEITQLPKKWKWILESLLVFIVLVGSIRPYPIYPVFWNTVVIYFIYGTWFLSVIAAGIVLLPIAKKGIQNINNLLPSDKWLLAIYLGNVLIATAFFLTFFGFSRAYYISGPLVFSFFLYLLAFLSIGIEYWTSYKMVVDELYANLSTANKQAHQQVYQETLLLSDKLYASITGQNNAEILQFTSALKSSEVFQTFLKEMAGYQNNQALVKAFRASLEYWWLNGNRDFYKENLLNNENDKLQLAQMLKDKNFNFAEDKLFVRMWRNHLAKGTTINGFYGVGNMLTGMAHFHGKTSLSIGTLRRFYEEDNEVKDIVNSKNFERNPYKELIPLGKQEE